MTTLKKLADSVMHHCRLPAKAYRDQPGATRIDNPRGELIHIDRGGDILCVAHLDYVLWQEPRRDNHIIRAPQLDDRLGVAIALDILPILGIRADVLLTDCEEIGQTTAEFYSTDKPYRYMVQFDRRGTDAVTYQYRGRKWRSALASHFELGMGSFSDISALDHIGIAGVNIGCAYHHEHTPQCYANLYHTIGQLASFVAFYRATKRRRFTYKPEPPIRRKLSSQFSWLKDDVWERTELFPVTYSLRELSAGDILCPVCQAPLDRMDIDWEQCGLCKSRLAPMLEG